MATASPGHTLQHAEQHRSGEGWLPVDEGGQDGDAEADCLVVVLLEDNVAFSATLCQNILSTMRMLLLLLMQLERKS